MRKIYLIETAIQCCYTSAHIFRQCISVSAATELEAAAIVLNNQPEQTYIFRIEVCHPQLYVFTFDQAKLLQQTFSVWQDLAAEATGHDTEWGYPISIESVAEALHIFPKFLTVLLANLTQPELELCLNKTALAFHYPLELLPENLSPNLGGDRYDRRVLSYAIICANVRSKCGSNGKVVH